MIMRTPPRKGGVPISPYEGWPVARHRSDGLYHAVGGEAGCHGILTDGVNYFGVSILGYPLGDSAGLGFLSICDGLRGALGDGIGPNAVVVANATHGISGANFKLFHGVTSCVVGGLVCLCLNNTSTYKNAQIIR